MADRIEEAREQNEYWEKAFGEKVRRIRQARGWSQRDLADRLALEGFTMHQVTLAKLERGERPLRVAEASALATVLGMPPLLMFYGLGPEGSDLRELQVAANNMQKKLDAALKALRFMGEAYATAEAEMISFGKLVEEARQRGEPIEPAPSGQDEDTRAIYATAMNEARDRMMAALDLPPEDVEPARTEAGRPLDNLFAPGGYQPLDDYGPD